MNRAPRCLNARRSRRAHPATPARRGTVLLAVMIIVVLVSLTGVSMIDASVAATETIRGTQRRTQARLAAWSAVQVVTGELMTQRETLLAAGDPDLRESAELFEDARGRTAYYRILPGPRGLLATPEAARISINAATEEMLAALPGVGPSLAKGIVGARERGPIFFERDLLTFEGINADSLARPASGGPGQFAPDASSDDLPNGAGSFPGGDRFAEPRSPIDLLTALSFDPNLASGARSSLPLAEPLDPGAPRLNVGVAWSDELEEAFREQWGDEVAAGARRFFDRESVEVESLTDAVALYREANLPTAIWPVAFDALTHTDKPFLPGLVDINRAPPEVIAAIPGVDAAMADRIAAARDKLAEADRRAITWPIDECDMSIDDFAIAAPWLTTRSLQWRVTIEVGFRPAAEAGPDGIGGDASGALRTPYARQGDGTWPSIDDDAFFNDRGIGGLPGESGTRLEDRRVYDLIIDVAGHRPRIAFFQDRTMRPVADALARLVREEDAVLESRDPDDPDRPIAGDSSAASGVGDSSPSGEGFAFPEAPIGAGIDPFGEPPIDRFADVTFDPPEAAAFGGGGFDPPASPGERRSTSDGPQDRAGSSGASVVPGDNRIGRWTAGGPR